MTSSTTTSVVAPLRAFGRADVATVGGKGANLGELVRAGFAVPDGFVVSTQAYRDALSSAGVEAGPGVLEAIAVPADLVAAIAEAYEGLGGGPVAVRSSATAEDLPGAAFAGQQETFLNVVGLPAVVDAVRGCWASLWGERAVAYRARLDEPVDLAIAVVVQRMVDAELAGVLFTANPVTGARDEVVVELSPGLGEAVVSGLVTPERVLTDPEGRVRERRPGRQEVVVRTVAGGGVTTEAPAGPRPTLPSAVLSELARTGVRIAAHNGCPQDIEWAHADGATWIVQARPMTALPPAPRKVNRARRLSATVSAELVPTRPYPLDLTAWTRPAWFAILRAMAAELAGLSIDVEQMLRETDAVVTELVPPVPRPTWRTLSSPSRLLARGRRYDPAVWTADPRFAAYEGRLGVLASQDLTALAWPELVAVPRKVLDALDAFVALRIDYLPAVLGAVVRLRLLLAVLGLSAEFWPLLAGQVTQTRAANAALEALADDIRRTPVWADAFAAEPGDAQLARTIETSAELAPLRARVRAWLDAYGHRETTSPVLITDPTWAEDPGLLLGSLRGLLARPAGGATVPADADPAVRRIQRLRRVRVGGLDDAVVRAAAAARTGMAFREDSHFHALRGRPLVRAALLEAGRRLCVARVLAHRDEVFHLTLDELQALPDPDDLDENGRRDLRERVRRRRLRRAELGSAPLISPATLFPDMGRPARDALATGSPGGGGRATGTVRIIRGPAEFGLLRPGEVLVCPYTNPAWTPLFQVAAAVVADSGSSASHAAIVAREYGIPAVLGTGNGTRVLAEGAVVQVDGDRGQVRAAWSERRDG